MRPTPLSTFAKLLGQKAPSSTIVKRVSIDSRLVEAGDLFFALTGAKVDSHDYLKEVAEKNAVGAVISNDYKGPTFGLEVLRVQNVRDALQHLAKEILKTRKTRVLGITGSLGKTTTKEFVATLLRTSYKVAATARSFNSQAMLPVSILNEEGDEDILVLEMGMSEPGELGKLVAIAPPEVALLTTVAAQHTNNFPDGLLGVSREKGLIFSSSQTRLGLISRDIPYFDDISRVGTCPKMTFSSKDSPADFRLVQTLDGVVIYANGHLPLHIPLQLPNKAHYHNLLAAITAARAFEVSWEHIREAAMHVKLPPMRFERVEKMGITFINDAYNANVESMQAALENLPKPLSGSKTIAVLGDMNALGMYSEQGHEAVGKTAFQCADVLLCIGPRCKAYEELWKGKKEFALCQSKEELLEKLKSVVRSGDVVLLKGARPYSLDDLLKGFD